MVGPSSSSSSDDLISSLDLDNPLHLQNSDFNSGIIIYVKLTGTENYRVWAAAMKLAINTRNKVGFIDGTCLKSAYEISAPLSNQWERCNSIVLFWLLNYVSEDLFLVQIFSDNASEVVAELKELMINLMARDDVLKHSQLMRLVQILMGLNDVYQLMTYPPLRLKGLPFELERDILPIIPRNLQIVSSGVKPSSRWLLVWESATRIPYPSRCGLRRN
ncbi:ribonuclease H-like domain-containing protein [Tanacetum coccineum]|uniref:Ribonuclease H-like domain-containing protein n=1 Tax=Tanacetum coccineum TaxID=301880 RepID=A0ABQ5E4U1_9ASTR